MVDAVTGCFIAGGDKPFEWIDDDEASEFRSDNSKSSAHPLVLASINESKRGRYAI